MNDVLLYIRNFDYSHDSANVSAADRAKQYKKSEVFEDTIRYDTRCYFNVRSKADISQLNLPHGTDN